MPKLKVFRTAIGFHDAYVAATSRKAALEAWGSDKDLFARGVAEEVTDPALAADALATPGEVIRRLRGTAAEQLAAAPAAKRKRTRKEEVEDEPAIKPRKTARTAAPRPERRPAPPPPPPPPPPPSREALDAAEAEVARAEREQKAALAEIADREAALARERRRLERDGADAIRRLTRRRDEAQAAYDAAVARWRG